MSTSDHPPTPASFLNNIDLNAGSDSRIASVSVYTGRAEVTRVFKFSVKTGQNLVNVNGLPTLLEPDSVRVEGRGPATIHDVTVGRMPQPPEPDVPAALLDLLEHKDQISEALQRGVKLREAIQRYLATLDVQHVRAHELDKIMEGCEAADAKVEDRIRGLKKQLKAAEKDIQKQQEAAASESSGIIKGQKDKPSQLGTKVSLSLFVEKESEVELVLVYAVLNATWTPIYDVRVDMQARETPITLIYKAAIVQDTAEDWKDVPLTLETATPTFQVGIPTLYTWTLSVNHPSRVAYTAAAGSRRPAPPPLQTMLFSAPSRSGADTLVSDQGGVPSPLSFRGAAVSSKGNVSATFTVPGIITIPSDTTAHNVTITELKLDATMSWVAVPKLDPRVRLSAKIRNASEYTLLTGSGKIYVDGSFIAKSNMPAVSPGENFDCALGLDPAIRITYHPISRKTAQIGFVSKTSVNSYSQRISVHNTKSITIKDLRIVDQVPVSADESITVKLITPALPSVPSRLEGSVKEEKKVDRSRMVNVSPGIKAEWGDGMEDATSLEGGTAVVGQDGKLSWVCEIPSQGKVNLLLQWEVTSPASTYVHNL